MKIFVIQCPCRHESGSLPVVSMETTLAVRIPHGEIGFLTTLSMNQKSLFFLRRSAAGIYAGEADCD